jgi:hypothetical protein
MRNRDAAVTHDSQWPVLSTNHAAKRISFVAPFTRIVFDASARHAFIFMFLEASTPPCTEARPTIRVIKTAQGRH